MSTVRRLSEQQLIRPPRWLPVNIQYETIVGSVAYGVSSDTSDMDIYGWAIPPKDDIFPHLRGEIVGFGTHLPRFEQFVAHHVDDASALAGAGRRYDITVYGIVKFFRLALENNPNVIGILFTPGNCVLHSTRIGTMVREARRSFLHKGAWPKFKGYAYSQLHKLAIKESHGVRAELVKEHGYDVKFAYHVIRLLSEVEMILTEHDIDPLRNSEQLKSIRRGEWTEDHLRRWCAEKELQLEKIFAESTLRQLPDEQGIKKLLMQCLEEHYGSLSGAVEDPDLAVDILRRIQAELGRAKGIL